MTPTSAERGHETRERLLDAAAQLIVEDGWGAVTTRRVADRAGLRPGLVHYHFRTVSELLTEAALASARREVRSAVDVLAQAADPADGLARVLEAMSTYGADDPTTVLFSEMLLASTRLEGLRVELAGLLAEWRSAVADWLRSAGAKPAAGATGGSDTSDGSDGSDSADAFEATAVLLGAALDGLVLHKLIDPALAEISVVEPLTRLAGAEQRRDN